MLMAFRVRSKLMIFPILLVFGLLLPATFYQLVNVNVYANMPAEPQNNQQQTGEQQNTGSGQTSSSNCSSWWSSTRENGCPDGPLVQKFDWGKVKTFAEPEVLSFDGKDITGRVRNADGTITVRRSDGVEGTQTYLPEGGVQIKFADGQTRISYPDGAKEITSAKSGQKVLIVPSNGIVQYELPDGTKIQKNLIEGYTVIQHSDQSVETIKKGGIHTLVKPDGSVATGTEANHPLPSP
jgi:hypothetical protein